jgi:CTP synthase
LPLNEPDLKFWTSFNETLATLTESVDIAIVGKYTKLGDTYKSLGAAFIHAQMPTKTKVNLTWIDAEDLTEKNVTEFLGNKQGILVPGGFGERGIEGKILAARYARENNIPYFGICLGMQIAVIEFARNVLKLADANSTEFAPNTKNPVVDFMFDQKGQKVMGGTLRRGASTASVKKGSLAHKIYGSDTITERHRHRYEFNMKYVPQFEEHGFMVSSFDQKLDLPEIIEIPHHPFFIAGQFHPEYKSRPWQPHPLFVAFIKAAKEKK